MEKVCLAVNMEDKEYQTRFLKCMMKHYKNMYEIHVINEMERLVSEKSKGTLAVIISDRKETLDFADEITRVLFLQEDIEESSSENENVRFTQKYQEVYKIMEKIELLTEKKYKRKDGRNGRKIPNVIGVYSLEKEEMQLPFCVLLAEVLAEAKKVLLMDLQPYSGLLVEQGETKGTFGLEDLLTIATTEIYTTNRLMASIGHEQKWDYIYPVKNTVCLAEAREPDYQRVLDILSEEKGYDYVIVNFGAVFEGCLDFMENSDLFYFLKARGENCNWREESFLDEMERMGKSEFLRKIVKVEIPMEFVKEKSWRQLAKSWLWGEVGDLIRAGIWMEN